MLTGAGSGGAGGRSGRLTNVQHCAPEVPTTEHIAEGKLSKYGVEKERKRRHIAHGGLPDCAVMTWTRSA